jgi:hypothetical protein
VPDGDAIVRTQNPAVGQRVGSQGCTATDDFDGIVQKGSAIHLTARPAHPCTFQRPMYCVFAKDSVYRNTTAASKNLKPEVYVKRSPLVQRLKLSAVMQCYGIASTFGILT